MTTTPRRIQRLRTNGWRVQDHTTSPLGAVYVGRPTRFGNPFRVAYEANTSGWHVTAPHGFGVGTFPTATEGRRYATDAYRVWITQPEQTEQLRLFRALLHGRDLTCWCKTTEPCHADVLLDLANRSEEPTR